jgi:hypothetical protein
MTPDAKASEYVTYEWAFAWGAGVRVIPIMYKEKTTKTTTLGIAKNRACHFYLVSIDNP